MFTITELKKHLGPGLGLRKNKYLLEIPIPGIEGQTLNILCRSAGLPEKNISVSTVYHKGRKYNMRGETDFTGSYEISLVDDSNMSVRTAFDNWMKQVDNTKPKNEGIIGASFEELAPGLLDNITDGLEVIGKVKSIMDDPGSLISGLIDGSNVSSMYQTDINIWQLGNNNQKVKGYKLQNAFPSSIGIVTLDDGDENTLSEFSVTLSYSEFVPLDNSGGNGIIDSLLGDSLVDIGKGIESLFD